MAWFSKKPRIATAPEPVEAAQSACRASGPSARAATRSSTGRSWRRTSNVCPHCEHHLPWPARARLAALLDPDSFEEFDKELEPQDPLGFSDTKKYKDRLKSTRKALGENDAFISGVGRIEGKPVSVGCFVFEFMGGSMGSVVGEKVTRVFERAHRAEVPGHRLLGLGRRAHAGGHLLPHADGQDVARPSPASATCGKPYISVLLHPTTGGVAASFSWLGDVILAEPKALIGFAGPRVIEQTIRQKLPEGFQRSEFLLEHGMIDAIVHRKELRTKLGQLLGLLG